MTIRINLQQTTEPSEPVARPGYHWGRILAAGFVLVVAVALGFSALWPTEQPAVAEVITTQSGPGMVAMPASDNAPVIDSETLASTPAPTSTSAPAQAHVQVQDQAQTQAPTPTPSPAIATAEPADAMALPAPVSQPVGNEAPAMISPAPETTVTTHLHAQSVHRFQLTPDVQGREPQGTIDHLVPVGPDAKAIRLHAFSEVHGLAGQTLSYRWLHQGRLLANVKVGVGSDRWRSSSNKLITPTMTGQWRVELRSSEGKLLAEAQFIY